MLSPECLGFHISQTNGFAGQSPGSLSVADERTGGPGLNLKSHTKGRDKNKEAHDLTFLGSRPFYGHQVTLSLS